MIVQIITLKLKKKMDLGNMENQKRTDQILLYKWDYLWMAMVFLQRLILQQGIQMNKLL